MRARTYAKRAIAQFWFHGDDYHWVMSKYVQFERLREKAESIVRHEVTPRFAAGESYEDQGVNELQHELNVQKIEIELQREAIEHIERRLEQRIEERTAELEGANRSLKAEIKVRRGIESRLRRNRRRLRSLESRLASLLCPCGTRRSGTDPSRPRFRNKQFS